MPLRSWGIKKHHEAYLACLNLVPLGPNRCPLTRTRRATRGTTFSPGRSAKEPPIRRPSPQGAVMIEQHHHITQQTSTLVTEMANTLHPLSSSAASQTTFPRLWATHIPYEAAFSVVPTNFDHAAPSPFEFALLHFQPRHDHLAVSITHCATSLYQRIPTTRSTIVPCQLIHDSLCPC